MSYLDVKSVSKAHGQLAAIRNVSFSMPAASRTAIVGPSGSGKTTLLRVIAGFDTPDTGSIALDGRCLVGDCETVPAHLREIGYVAQDGALFPHLTVAANIAFGMPKDADTARKVAELMNLVGFDRGMAERRPHQLSGGQQQRVALARALGRKPRLMLLDEPFSALDTGLRTQTRKAVANVLLQAGIATILVTHDEAEALSFADQVAVMQKGELVRITEPRELYLRPRHPGVADFIGEANILEAQVANGQATCSLGTIPIDDAQRTGTARILVRPEQLRIAPVQDDAASPGPGIGDVTEVDFGGAVCFATIVVTRPGSPDKREPLLVQCICANLPVIGQRVRVALEGQAHVLDANHLP